MKTVLYKAAYGGMNGTFMDPARFQGPSSSRIGKVAGLALPPAREYGHSADVVHGIVSRLDRVVVGLPEVGH